MTFTSPTLCFEKSVKFSTRSSRRVGSQTSANHHLQRHPARLVLALDALPLEEPLPVGRERADAAVRAVGGDEDSALNQNTLRDAVLLVLVAASGCSSNACCAGTPGFFSSMTTRRQAVDEADQVRAAGVERAGDGELADQEEVICLRGSPSR